MFTPHLDRASVLLKQNRYADAEREIKNALATNPNDGDALTLLAICLTEQDKLDDAERAILDSLKVRADNDYAMMQHARILYLKHRNQDAELAVRHAIGLNPFQADYFGLLSVILLTGKKFNEALQAAENGLAIDPENLFCLNQRSTALVKLDRKDEAFETIDKALERDPDNEYTHANYGWGHLEKGDHHKALEHFREALKLNPNYEYAKAGLVEALKARYWFYRMFLKYNLWVSNLSGRAQWMFIIGVWFSFRILRGLASSNPTLQKVLLPVMVLYFLFVLSTWVMRPLSNLFLRLNIYGRYALRREEILSSNYVGISLALSLVAIIVFAFTRLPGFLSLAIVSFLMMIPLASMFQPVKPKHKQLLFGYTFLLALFGIAGAALQFFNEDIGDGSLGIFFIGIIAYQWVVNFILIRT